LVTVAATVYAGKVVREALEKSVTPASSSRSESR